MMLLYGYPLSGNTHKVRLLLGFLGMAYEDRVVDLLSGEHKKPEFLALNPNGTVPVIDDDGIVIRDSQAILVYVARKAKSESFLPTDAENCARVAQWLSFAANEIQHGPGRARLETIFNLPGDHDATVAKAERVLGIIEDQLARDGWLECGRMTIADIACAPYVALAPQGGVAIEGRSNIMAWLDRIKATPGFVAMKGFGD